MCALYGGNGAVGPRFALPLVGTIWHGVALLYLCVSCCESSQVRWVFPPRDGFRVTSDQLFASVDFEGVALGAAGNSICFSARDSSGALVLDKCFHSYPECRPECSMAASHASFGSEEGRAAYQQQRWEDFFPGSLSVLVGPLPGRVTGRILLEARAVVNAAVVAQSSVNVIYERPSVLSCEAKEDRRFLVDAFPFFDEFDVLEIRLQEAGHLFDRIFIVESETTHSGFAKPLRFKQAMLDDPATKARFAPWARKIENIMLTTSRTDEMRAKAQRRAAAGNALVTNLDIWQRDEIIPFLKDLVDRGMVPTQGSTVLLSDVDEVPRVSAVEYLRRCDSVQLPLALELDWFHYSFRLKAKHRTWGLSGSYQEGPVAVSVQELIRPGAPRPSELRRMSFNKFSATGLAVISNAGWHLSRFGNVASVLAKIRASDTFAVQGSLLVSDGSNVADSRQNDNDERLVEQLLHDGFPLLPRGENELDGKSFFQQTSIDEISSDLPGGRTRILDTPRFAHMFQLGTGATSIAGDKKDNIAVQPPPRAMVHLFHRKIRTSIRNGVALNLYVQQRDASDATKPPTSRFSIPCEDSPGKASPSSTTEQVMCRPLGLAVGLCQEISSEVESICQERRATCIAGSVETVNITAVADPTAHFQFHRSKITETNAGEQGERPTLYEVRFSVNDDVADVVDQIVAALDSSEIDEKEIAALRSTFLDLLTPLYQKLGIMYDTGYARSTPSGEVKLLSPSSVQAQPEEATQSRSNAKHLTTSFSRVENIVRDGKEQEETRTAELEFGCTDEPSAIAARLCALDMGPGFSSLDPRSEPFALCSRGVNSRVSQEQAKHCSALLEDWLDRPLHHLLRFLQWRILDDSLHHGVKTWKFPFDLWIYQEILSENPPDVLIEVGNKFGGSALYFARLFDALQLPGRIIAVDIDHSKLDARAKHHPRITWIEDDAVAAAQVVEELIVPGETVMLVEDASHTFAHTLEIMQNYAPLVTNGSWMIIEDTVLHNGVENTWFNDPGAFASVEAFLTQDRKHHREWRLAREMERFVVTWNPRGFMQRIKPPASADPERPPHSGLPDKRRFLTQLMNGDASSSLVRVESASQIFLNPDERQIPLPGLRVGMHTLASLTEQVMRAAASLCGGRDTGAESLVPDDCTERLATRAMGRVPQAAQLDIAMAPEELVTPFHPPPLALSRLGAKKVIRQMLTKGRGAAVLADVLPQAQAAHLRTGILASPAFQALATQLPASRQSRYLNVLCANEAEGCAPVPGALEILALLVQDSHIASSVRSMLGDDFLLDSASLSIQWPGAGRFGPHVDRPFLRGPDAGDWTYSSRSMPLPPKDYPLSLQAVVLLDNFTSSNGAFFVLPQLPRGSELDDPETWPTGATDIYHRYEALERRQDLEWLQEMDARLVTGSAGSVILAHGAAWHGALPNYSARPRLALLVQFVPRFVRPGQRFPRSVLDGLHNPLPPFGNSIPDVINASVRQEVLGKLLDLGKPIIEMSLRGPEGKSTVFAFDPRSDLSSLGQLAASATASVGGGPGAAQKLQAEALRSALMNYDLCHPPSLSQRARRLAAAGDDIAPRSQAAYSANPGHSAQTTGNDPDSVPVALTYKKSDTTESLSLLTFGFGSNMASLSPQEVSKIVKAVLAMGYKSIDTAEMYPNQAALGKAFAEIWHPDGSPIEPALYPPRESVRISSKLWATNMAPEHVALALNLTLETLKLSYIDAWLIHWPVPLMHIGVEAPIARGQYFPRNDDGKTMYAKGVALIDTWRAMEDLVLNDGTVGEIGICNAPGAMLHELASAEGLRLLPALNQVELHPMLPQKNLISLASGLGVQIEAYAPLASGHKALLEHKTVIAIAAENNLSAAEVLVLWAKAKARRVVYSSRNEQRAADMLRTFSHRDLSDAAVARIDSAVTTTQRVFGGPDSDFNLLFI